MQSAWEKVLLLLVFVFFSSGKTEMVKVLSNFIHLDSQQQERAGLGRVSDLRFDSLQRYNGK